MRKRKTVDVRWFVRTVNRAIEFAETEDERRALAFTVEAVLHESGTYAGFRYHSTEFSGDGRLLKDYDDTRRTYYEPTF